MPKFHVIPGPDSTPVYPGVRKIGPADLKDALAKGYEDFVTMPSSLIFLGLIYPIVGIGVVAGSPVNPYPALNRAGEGFVLGEVLRFENIEEALARFDRIEGFYGFGNSKNLFRRTVTTFSLVDGPVQTAWTYVTTRPEAPAIPSNDWRVHCGRRLDFVERLVAEHHCERILARASEDWAVGLPPLIRKHLRSQSVPLLELAQESAGIATPDNSEVSLVRFEPNTDEDVQEASEGRLLTRKHLARERNRKLVETKRRQALETYGKLTCEVCDFDFSASYGDRGHGFIECHHTKPVSTLAEGYSTHINDLVPVCANCHRMLHRTVPWLSISELKAILSPKACKRS